MAKLLTLTQLERAGACYTQSALFQKRFGNSVKVTEYICKKHAGAFSFYWAGISLLRGKKRQEFLKVYNNSTDKFSEGTGSDRAWAIHINKVAKMFCKMYNAR